jgi:uncharacterized protein (DUF952 family)
MLYHIADRHRWALSCDRGSYTQSTRGMELDDVGFIHLCTAEQVAGVLDRFYRGVDDLVMLHIDEQRVRAPIVFEDVPGADEQFPHLYGPLEPSAVVRATPVAARPVDTSTSVE